MDIREKLKKSLSYDPVTGIITWRCAIGRAKSGGIAGGVNIKGYLMVGFHGKKYLAHRLAWLLMTGDWPDGMIDHKNLNKLDNQFDNLRIASPAQNRANQKAMGKLPKGVTLHRTGKYQAQIMIGPKNRYLGLFAAPEEAHAAYVTVAFQYFGEFARAA
jgi:hypothetical protein